ncbi:angiopoietin-related protein 7-like [Gigantopelta aegis]|uniref:angiopoietin-related protein 7-like n=1 Tax=Gigantopelta aegis TaxID=1735272 RepID=UPI001B88CE46|nr:angiopoietin-related protein 7-like [Gigantopelta aegis]
MMYQLRKYFGLATVMCLVFHFSDGARKSRSNRPAYIRGSKCHYTFVVNEFDESKCPSVPQPIQSDAYTGNQYFRPPQDPMIKITSKNIDNLSDKMKDMESRLFDEMLKNRQINSTLSKHNYILKHTEDLLSAYKSNFSKIYRAMMYMETRLRNQRKISRGLNHKLTNVILDIVEVNNVLNKRPAGHLAATTSRKKRIAVEDATRIRSCPGITDHSHVYNDCYEVYQEGHRESDVYYIKPNFAACPVPVWCDMETPPGGWLVIQRRQNGQVNFTKTWDEYKRGFGEISHEHWLGNDNIFLISNQKFYQLRIDLWDFDGNRVYGLYKTFKIEGERDKYRLHVSSFEGSAKDALYRHNRMMFSTIDNDNDGRPDASCAKEWFGGWWYNNCWFTILNGPYFNQSNVRHRGISWNHWKREQLARTEMKIRPNIT